MATATVSDGRLVNLEVVTHIGETGRESVNHYRPRSSHRTLCGHTCDDDGAFGEWVADPDAHPEDADGMAGEVCGRCDASYRKARRIANGGPERKPDDRPAYKRERRAPRVEHVPVKLKRAPVDVFRMYRAELEALGTPEATAELKRRRAKRAEKRNRKPAV